MASLSNAVARLHSSALMVIDDADFAVQKLHSQPPGMNADHSAQVGTTGCSQVLARLKSSALVVRGDAEAAVKDLEQCTHTMERGDSL